MVAIKSNKRAALTIGGVALLAAAVRISQAMSGSVHAATAASEVGVGLSLLGVVLAVARLWADARRSGRVYIGITLLVWSALVVVPMWRLGHLPAPLFDGTLGGSERRVELGPAPATAVYTVEIRRPAAGIHDDYEVDIRIDGEERTLRSRFGDDPDLYAVPMEQGQKATLHLAVGDSATVEVALPTLPWRWVRVAALLLILLACVGEASVSRSQPTARGLWTVAIGVTSLYLVFLNPAQDPDGRAAIGAAMGSLAVGGLFGALWGSLVGRMRTRRSSR